jgi:hypothetical protein
MEGSDNILKKAIFGVILIIISFISLVFLTDLRQTSSAFIAREKEILPLLKNGDVICRLGDRVWSLAFKEFSPDDKRFSHLGIVLIQNGIVSVINAVGSRDNYQDKVAVVPLHEFLKHALKIGIYRIKDIDGDLLSFNALNYIDRPFDWDFDMGDDSKLYCSELLFVTLKDIFNDINIKTVWVKELSKDIIPVDMCFQSEYFTEIGYFEKTSPP